MGGDSSQKKEQERSSERGACIRRLTSEAGEKINKGNSVICAQVLKGDINNRESLMSLKEEFIAHDFLEKTSCHTTKSHLWKH